MVKGVALANLAKVNKSRARSWSEEKETPRPGFDFLILFPVARRSGGSEFRSPEVSRCRGSVPVPKTNDSTPDPTLVRPRTV